MMMSLSSSFAQTQRNPVLEYCTGTWCVYCPQGHTIINNDILPNIPNAIILGYHGPANDSRDPFSFFPGNSIISALGFSAYPTGIIDRTTGIQSRGAWYGYMNSRNSVPATVAIDIDRSLNQVTREFNASIDFTALVNLNGQYKFNLILLEDGMVWNQTGGSSNYVHKHVVRAMMNGHLGEEIINGAWNQNDVINRTVNYTIPVPSQGPDIIFDSCHVVVMVYKVGSPLNSNAEIQQAIQTTLISPDFVATIAATSPDIIGDNATPGQFTSMIYNQGLMDDMYYVDCTLDAPAGWSGDYTTVNGTMQFGQGDSVLVASGDSTEISITMNPNGFNGSGQATLSFQSKNNAGVTGTITFSLVTTTGVDILVVDASEDGYGEVVSNSLQNVYTGTYGVVSRTALHAAGVNLSSFYFVSWSAGITVPAFYPEEVDALQDYLDGGGRLFINGQDIGADIFEPTGQSQFAQSFYNNYLHTDYVSNSSNLFLVNGYDGDLITDGITFIINSVYDKSPESIAPYDGDATPIFMYLSGPLMGGIRAATSDYKIVYFGVGLEQIDDNAIRDTLVSRIVTWLKAGFIPATVGNETGLISFSLEQNYPNPFNPLTQINYSLAEEANVELKVYDIMGREVAEVVNEKQSAGIYSVDFDASELASGIYIYKLTADNFVSAKKMMLLK